MVMMMLCGLSLVYFIILQLVMNLYSLFLYLEKPPVEIKEKYTYVFSNWTSQSIEKLTNDTFPFTLGQITDVFESFEYPWEFDRTLLVLSGPLNVCQFVLVIGEMRLNRRIPSFLTPETYVASAWASATGTAAIVPRQLRLLHRARQ